MEIVLKLYIVLGKMAIIIMLFLPFHEQVAYLFIFFCLLQFLIIMSCGFQCISSSHSLLSLLQLKNELSPFFISFSEILSMDLCTFFIKLCSTYIHFALS